MKRLLRIQTVSELTGVPAALLRAWERRYGVPTPQRSESAYRLYDESDVAMVKQLRELITGGMAPAEAARQVLATRTTPLELAEDAPNLRALHHSLVEATLAFDSDLLERTVRRALFCGPAVTVFDQVFAPALRDIGERWECGTLSVAQEHMATEMMGTATRNLLTLVQPDSNRRAILACIDSELHVLPLYGIGLRLASWGIRVDILGAATPPAGLGEMVRRRNPDFVVLSATCHLQQDNAGRQLAEYATACGSIPWLLGGAGGTPLQARVAELGGVPCSGEISEFRASIEALSRSQRVRPGPHDENLTH